MLNKNIKRNLELPIDEGIFPFKLLPSNSIDVKDCKYPIAEGKVPVKFISDSAKLSMQFVLILQLNPFHWHGFVAGNPATHVHSEKILLMLVLDIKSHK